MILSIQQGYMCMFNFLDKIYFKTYLDCRLPCFQTVIKYNNQFQYTYLFN